MYVYCPFSPHNGITIGNVLILFFSPVNANFIFLAIIINLLPLYGLSCSVSCPLVMFLVLLCIRANFVIGLCAVKFARK
jgi:hypothetical protein